MSLADNYDKIRSFLEDEKKSSDSTFGHCSFEPGTYEWQLYQQERFTRLQKLKEKKEQEKKIVNFMNSIRSKSKAKNNKNISRSILKPSIDESMTEEGGLFLRPKTTTSSTSSKIVKFSPKVSSSRPTSASPGGRTNSKILKNGGVEKKSNSYYCPATTRATIQNNRLKMQRLCESSIKVRPQPKDEIRKENLSSSSNFSLSIKKEVEKVESQLAVKPPPQPLIDVCKALPGTREWKLYWKNFNAAIEKYNSDMKEYEECIKLFENDLKLYEKESKKVLVEKELLKKLGTTGIEMGLVPTPPIVSKPLGGLLLLNGYFVKSKNVNGTISSLPGSGTGVRIEMEIGPYDPDTILVEREDNLLTLSLDAQVFVRVGMRAGKRADEVEIWPPINGFIIIDAP